MSGVFDAYARYYDLLYRDKDYAAEVEYVVSHIRRNAPDAGRILELGCGTGTHAEYLARHGFTVHGVDLSDAMLAAAEARKRSLPPEIAGRINFTPGDARVVRLGKRFDAVISLFHVMSYQTTNTDLSAAFATAAAHLAPTGIFLFDFWYGPAVLTQRPEVRVKRLAENGIRVTRIAEPDFHPNKNVVDVNYEVLIECTRTGTAQTVRETHPMRYLFMPEIEVLLKQNGMELLRAYEWLMLDEPGFTSWNACAVARPQC